MNKPFRRITAIEQPLPSFRLSHVVNCCAPYRNHRTRLSSAATLTTTMSWMDSWSRPGKSQPVPPPYYLTEPQTKYCHTCGRIISERKSHKAAEMIATPPKYCSSRCRGLKPRERDRRVEAAFV